MDANHIPRITSFNNFLYFTDTSSHLLYDDGLFVNLLSCMKGADLTFTLCLKLPLRDEKLGV